MKYIFDGTKITNVSGIAVCDFSSIEYIFYTDSSAYFIVICY